MHQLHQIKNKIRSKRCNFFFCCTSKNKNLYTKKKIQTKNKLAPHQTLPCRHHVREPDPTQMLRHLPVNVVQLVTVIRNQHFLHDGQLLQSVSAHLHELHEGAAGHFALPQADGGQLRAALGDADELLVERPQPVGAHHQLHQTRAGEPDAAQHVFADGAAEVQVRDGDFVAEERVELLLVEVEVHHQVEFGGVAHHGVPAALLDGVELLAWVLADHVDAKVLEVNVLLRGERDEEFVAQQVVVQSQFSQAVALIGHAHDACKQESTVSRDLRRKKNNSLIQPEVFHILSQ